MKRSLIALVCLLAVPAAFAGGPKNDKIHKAKNKINGQYIIVLEDRYDDVAGIADDLAHQFRTCDPSDRSERHGIFAAESRGHYPRALTGGAAAQN